MEKKIQVLFMIISIFSITGCNIKSKPNLTSIDQLIQGYWKSNAPSFTLTIKDSFFYFNHAYSSNSTYHLRDSIFHVNTKSKYDDSLQIFKLVEFDGNNLKLALISENLKSKYGRKNFWLYSDTIEFVKIQKKNQFVPAEIGFNFGAAIGPSYIYHIDQRKQMYFFGRYNVPFTSGNTVVLSQMEYERIINEIQNIDFSKVDTLYEHNVTDGALIQLYLKTQDTIIRKTIIGMPITRNAEFNILLNNLVDLPFRIHMTKNNTIKDNFKFKLEYDSIQKWLFVMPPKLSN